MPALRLVGIESPLWPRTGTGSGWITTEAYDHFLGRMLAELEDGGRWHGVYLALHGAMGVRGVARPEADFAFCAKYFPHYDSRLQGERAARMLIYMNVFFGFPFADVPDVGMTVQVITNGKPELARKAVDDVATWAWRRREALLKTATVHPIPDGVKLAKEPFGLMPDKLCWQNVC